METRWRHDGRGATPIPIWPFNSYGKLLEPDGAGILDTMQALDVLNANHRAGVNWCAHDAVSVWRSVMATTRPEEWHAALKRLPSLPDAEPAAISRIRLATLLQTIETALEQARGALVALEVIGGGA